MKDFVFDFFKMFFTFIFLLDPIGNTPMFISVAGGYNRPTQLKILKHAILFAGLVLMIFSLGGFFILKFFGITPGSFYIAGGIIFFTIALDMIQSKPRSRHTPVSIKDPTETKMIAIFPLAFPLIAGPGMITTIMLYTANEPFYSNFSIFTMVILAVAMGLFIEYLVLRSGSLLIKVIGTTGMFVVEKIVGLILAGLAVQLVYDGILKLGIIK